MVNAMMMKEAATSLMKLNDVIWTMTRQSTTTALTVVEMVFDQSQLKVTRRQRVS